MAAARRFFSKAMGNNGTLRVITLNAYAASHRAVAEMKSALTMPRWLGTIQQVLEQHNCGGPPTDQTQGRAHAWLQAFRHGSDHDLWDRAGSEDQEATVQNRKSTEKTEVDAWNLGGRSGGSKLKPLSPGELNRRAKR